jgi:uncharacterized membrane protein YedE/YeeE
MVTEEINTDFETQSIGEKPGKSTAVKPGIWQYAGYAVLGILFGIVLVKAEVINWFRIQEMFRFQSFHMFGVIGSAVVTGLIALQLLKWKKAKSLTGASIEIPKRHFQWGQVYGGLMFGLGWAMTGACPGPVFALIGSGVTVFLVVLLSAIVGTWTYGALAKKLPH